MSKIIMRVVVMAGALLVVAALVTACGEEGKQVADVGAPQPTAADADDHDADADDHDAVVDGSGADPTVVNVVMEETDETWAFQLDRTEIPAGEVTFAVKNEGQLEHELMIYPAQDLTHLIEELVEGAGGAHVEENGHAEGIDGLVHSADGVDELVLEPGQEATFTVNLTSGTYELGCLIVETVGGETFTHHEKGMHNSVTIS